MNRTLGYITPVRAFSSAGEIYMQAASGRVAEALAKHYEKVCVCARVVQHPPAAPFDFPLDARNLELVAQPFWSTTARSALHAPRALAHRWSSGLQRPRIGPCLRIAQNDRSRFEHHRGERVFCS